MNFFSAILLLLFTSLMILPAANAEEQVYVGISNCEDLQNMALDLYAAYELTQDIDCSGVNFTPVGNYSNPFRGQLNGNGYKIKHLYINKEAQSPVGLFSYVSNNNVSFTNLTFEDAVVIGGNYVGILAGYISEAIRVSDIHAQGSVEAKMMGTPSYAGGLIGYLASIREEASHLSADVDVKAVSTGVGGLIGAMSTPSLDSSFATGSVSSSGIGGSTGVGGLVGSGALTLVSNSYATGDVTAVEANMVGGLIGSGASVANSYATGDVIGDTYVGGLMGRSGTGNVYESYAHGNVTGYSRVGGLIGQTTNSANVFSHNYSSGKVTGNSNVGGLTGESSSLNWINSYWDTEASGQPISQGGEGKTTTEMLDKSTYAGWDFEDTWEMRAGRYPWLQALGEPEVEISNCRALQDMAQNLQGTYQLVADIDCAKMNFSPVGTIEAPFEGRFDGNGYVIRHLDISYVDETFVGLWGVTSGASLQNVKVEALSMYGREYVGGLVGLATNTQITNARVTGMIYSAGEHPSKGTIGGLVGFLSNSKLERSSTLVDINALYESASFMGGLVGESDSSEITNSYAQGSVYGDSYVGGLVGYSGESTFENTYAAMKVSANEASGGLIGGANTTEVLSSYWDIDVSGFAVSAGGEGKTSVQMWQQNTYENWDFEKVWAIQENQHYPDLRLN